MTEKEKSWALKPLSGTSLKDSGEEFHPVGIILSSTSCFTLCLEGEMARYGITYIPIHGRWPMVLLEVHGLGKNKIRKLMTKKFGEEICR